MLKFRKCKLDTSCLHLENTAERSKAVVYRIQLLESRQWKKKAGLFWFQLGHKYAGCMGPNFRICLPR